MHSLYTITSGKSKSIEELKKSEKLSLYYHDLFDYPLTFADLIKWNVSENIPLKPTKIPITYQNGYYFLKGRKGLIYKRVLRSRVTAKKMEIAHKTSQILSLIPGVKMVGVTGSLAMENAVDESDIDLIIITKSGTLWTTRAFAYIVIHALGLSARKPNDSHQKDKLCFNMWMDETDLEWKRNDRNFYTAHEIAQIVPLVNKEKAYEKFLYKNKWILEFWPNAVKIVNCANSTSSPLKIENSRAVRSFLERIAYKTQLNHMKPRITREIVTPTRAIFHPQDWGKIVISRLGS